MNYSRFIIDSALIILLFGLFVLPISSFGLLHLDNVNSNEVLSVQDELLVDPTPQSTESTESLNGSATQRY